MSEYSNLSRLQEENRKVVVDLHSRLNTWEKFKKDYEDLQELLATLPQKVSHETMVPIGSVAFMPGKLVHTNEIMVLLGDNWFAERSASQAIETVERRKKYLDACIAGIKEDLKGFDSRMKFTADIQAAAQETDGLREIKEELTPLEEERIASRGSRKAHPKAQKVGGSRKVEGLKRADNSNTPTQKREKENLSTEELSLFARLEKLEEEEEKNVKLNEPEIETFIDETSKKATGTVFSNEEVRWTQSQKIYRNNNRQSKIGKTVTWKDDLTESDLNVGNNNGDVENSDDDDDDGDDDNETVKNTICVRFTSLDASAEQGKTVSKSSKSTTVVSPADIYNHFTHNKELKRILKKPSVEIEKKSEISQDRKQRGTKPDQSVTKSSEMEDFISQKAFSGTVVERQSIPQSDQCKSEVIVDANQISQSQASKKPSRFKASRQKLS